MVLLSVKQTNGQIGENSNNLVKLQPCCSFKDDLKMISLLFISGISTDKAQTSLLDCPTVEKNITCFVLERKLTLFNIPAAIKRYYKMQQIKQSCFTAVY